jgi:hypothetical protein
MSIFMIFYKLYHKRPYAISYVPRDPPLKPFCLLNLRWYHRIVITKSNLQPVSCLYLPRFARQIETRPRNILPSCSASTAVAPEGQRSVISLLNLSSQRSETPHHLPFLSFMGAIYSGTYSGCCTWQTRRGLLPPPLSFLPRLP